MTKKGLIITGTDTDAGKTMVSAALFRQYCAINPNLYYWKPVQTGYPPDDDTQTVVNLSGCNRTITGLRYSEPVSPHLAAEIDGQQLDAGQILSMYNDIQSDVLIEGAGGLFVPLNRKVMFIDVFARLQLPVVLVARTLLGTINHTMLSVEALQRRSIPIAAIAFFDPFTDTPDRAVETDTDESGQTALMQAGDTQDTALVFRKRLVQDNMQIIAEFTGLTCLGPITYDNVVSQADDRVLPDPDYKLAKWLG